MADVCLATVVDHIYADYIPMFIWCAKFAYPEYDIKLFTRGGYPADDEQTKRVSMVRNHEADCPFHGYNTCAMRFTIPKEHFKDYKHIYITDIDMMIVRENTKLHDFHLEEMKDTGYCYSNSLRNKKHWKGFESLTGLHFCNYEWFERVEPHLQKYRDEIMATEVKREYDGHMLWRLTRDAGLGLPKKYPLICRHHGIHLGNFRLFKKKKRIEKRIDHYKKVAWRRYMIERKFQRIVERACKNSTIKKQVENLNAMCGI